MSQDKSKYMQINLVKKGKKDKKRASSKQHIFIDYKPPSTSTRGPNLKFSFFSNKDGRKKSNRIGSDERK